MREAIEINMRDMMDMERSVKEMETKVVLLRTVSLSLLSVVADYVM
jgi:hypothetical protein